MIEKWCWNWIVKSTPKYKDTTICGNWTCVCGELLKNHIIDGLDSCAYTGCDRFYFKDNNKCTLECQMLFKIVETTNLYILNK